MVLLASGAASAQLDSAARESLKEALEDERHSEALYNAVIARHGAVLPFANIVRSERRHQAIVESLMGRYGVDVPPNAWSKKALDVPSEIAACCALSRDLEKANIAMYDRLLAKVTQADIRESFRALQAMSRDRHLVAFSRCADGQPCGRWAQAADVGDGSPPGVKYRAVLTRMAKLDRAYIPALALTSQGRKEDSIKALARLHTDWEGFVKEQASAFLGDDRWKQDIANVSERIRDAGSLAGAGKLAEAHEALEVIRFTLGDARKRHGLEYFLDPLHAFHEHMEALAMFAKSREGSGLSDADLAKMKQDLLPPVVETFAGIAAAPIDRAALGLDAAAEARTRAMVKDLGAAVKRFETYCTGGDRQQMLKTALAVKPAFVKLFTSFGDFEKPPM